MKQRKTFHQFERGHHCEACGEWMPVRDTAQRRWCPSLLVPRVQRRKAAAYARLQ
ncbi:MAG: hypothetical protein KatS3mg038_2384 [Candidatus Kapaibacterium sp.]|nr:MAG: hypothetical protein KatS3mg038_2384 [Candidatus Kapabacteria bacterium]